MKQRGLFITVEGIEGAGKSTAMTLIESSLRKADIDLVATREPGGTALGERLRNLLLTPSDTAIDARAELLMMFAARAQHLHECIRPALEGGRWVLCDRFTDASYAYQGAGREMGADAVATLEDLVQGALRPDIILLLDVPVELGIERARGRGALDRFEQEDRDFFERARRAYLDRAAHSSGRYRIIDGSRPLHEVQDALRQLVSELIACPPLLEDR